MPDSSLFHQLCTPHHIAGETLLLHHDRAVFWPGRQALLVADLHFGKEPVFGRAGIAIPDGVSESDMRRLAALLAASGARRLYILGDFMHAIPADGDRWLAELGLFLDAHRNVDMVVVAGNHDRPAGRDRIDRRIRWIEETLVLDPFVLRHHPVNDPRGYVLAGHLHPLWRLADRRRNSLTAPVFWFRQHHGVLPAFGRFTGGRRVPADEDDQLFIAGPDCVIPVPAAPVLMA